MRYALLLLVCVPLAAAGCARPAQTTPAPSGRGVVYYRNQDKTKAEGAQAGPAATGWASLKGVFKLSGAVPQLKPLPTGGKDGEVCDAHAIPDERLLVDSASKGIKNVAIYALKVSRTHPDYDAEKAK